MTPQQPPDFAKSKTGNGANSGRSKGLLKDGMWRYM